MDRLAESRLPESETDSEKPHFQFQGLDLTPPVGPSEPFPQRINVKSCQPLLYRALPGAKYLR